MNLFRLLWSKRVNFAGALIHRSGVGALCEMVAPANGAIVLMYHSVATPSEARFIDPSNRISSTLFERQMRFLGQHRQVWPISKIVEYVVKKIEIPAGVVGITFDDGYLDNLTVAAPILKKYKLEATLFLATGYIERQQMQWADSLHCHFQYRTRHQLTMSDIGLNCVDVRLHHERSRARLALHRYLLTATWAQREDLLQQVAAQLQPNENYPRTSLGWDDVRTLRRDYPAFEVGGHTRNHIDLRTQGAELVQEEVTRCEEDIYRETGERSQHFSFPYGRWSMEAQKQVRSAGWRSAVGAGTQYRIGPGSDLFALARVPAPSSMTSLRFKTSGAYPRTVSLLGDH